MPSEYCEYDKTSATYDLARRPLDIDDLLTRIEALAATRGCSVSDLKLLDIGSGSGNYFQGLRERGCLIQYHGLEGSQVTKFDREPAIHHLSHDAHTYRV